MTTTITTKLNGPRASAGKTRPPVGAGTSSSFTGTPLVNNVLTGVDPTGTGVTVISRKWQHDVGAGYVDIAGATSATYTVQSSDLVSPGLIRYVPTVSLASNASAAQANKPLPPTIGTLVAGTSKATANWTAPTSDGGSAITGYKVTGSNGNIVTALANETSKDVPAANGSPLTVIVQALNAIGYSDPSAPSNSVTPNATKIVSASVRGKIPFTTGQFSTSFPVKYYRTYDKTNVAVPNPSPKLLHAYVVGVTGQEQGCNPTLPSTTTVAYEYSMLTNITGRGIDQTAATLTHGTFNGMTSNAAFISAGGSVTGGGYVCNAPENFLIEVDPLPLNLAAGQSFMHQVKIKGADQVRHPANISSHITGMGDLIYNAPGEAGPGATGDLILSKNWAGVPEPGQFGAILAPWMTLGLGSSAVSVYGVFGDSVENGIAGDSTLALTSEDFGDADGVQNYVKRGLNALGKSFIDVSVSGSNIRNIRDTFPATQNGWRMYGLSFCDHAFNGLGKNDRSSGHPYYNSAGLGTLTEYITTLIRSKIKAGGKVIGMTFPPATFCTVANTAITSSGTMATATTATTANMTSGATHTIAGATPAGFNVLNAVCTVIDGTHYSYPIADLSGASATVPGTWADGWKTEVNQTPKNGDTTWPTLGEAASTGQQFTYNDRTMRRGAYAGLAYGGATKEYDGGFDFASYCAGSNAGLFGVNGTRYYKSDDGTHPKATTVHVQAAAGFVTAFPGWGI